MEGWEERGSRASQIARSQTVVGAPPWHPAGAPHTCGAGAVAASAVAGIRKGQVELNNPLNNQERTVLAEFGKIKDLSRKRPAIAMLRALGE